MDNNFNQQPQYQQPQYQQPQYQQPQYAAPQPRPQGAGLDGFINFLVKLAPIAILIFLGLGGVGFLYELINGAVNVKYSIGNIIYGFADGLAVAAKYCFYSIVVAFAAKLLKK